MVCWFSNLLSGICSNSKQFFRVWAGQFADDEKLYGVDSEPFKATATQVIDNDNSTNDDIRTVIVNTL